MSTSGKFVCVVELRKNEAETDCIYGVFSTPKRAREFCLKHLDVLADVPQSYWCVLVERIDHDIFDMVHAPKERRTRLIFIDLLGQTSETTQPLNGQPFAAEDCPAANWH